MFSRAFSVRRLWHYASACANAGERRRSTMKTLCSLLLLVIAAGAPARSASWETAEANASESRQAIRLSKRLVFGWLDQADPKTGLISRNLTRDWFWNAKDAAADNFPFFLLTAFVTGDYHMKQTTLGMLAREQKLTNRLDRLPDDYLFDRQGFRPGPYRLDDLIFGASEYAKDGLTPLTEWLGPGPWLDRMTGLIDDIWKHAPIDSESGRLPSRSVEVNGNMLQVGSRLYWLTGDDTYRRWAFRLTDHYFLHENILEAERLQLDDHSCEIIGGLAEGYVVAAKTDPDRWRNYHGPMHAILDRVLKYGRNQDGLLYHTVDPRTGKVLNPDLTDNWGYNYNAFLTVAAIDGTGRYREAVEKVLGNIHQYVDYPWERGGADGYADSIEGGINLLNRVPVESGFGWVDASMRTLFAKQGEDGIIEGWHGDGNSARTALMYALWKTQGITAIPWRQDLELGAVRESDGSVKVFVRCARPWTGALRFDRRRHRENLHLPFDYARINQFPEWFIAEAGKRYRVLGEASAPQVVDGKDLWHYNLVLEPNRAVRLTVKPE